MEEGLVIWAVIALVEGAISYVGGVAMKNAMGGVTILDVRTWIREAVAELEKFVTAKLDEIAFQKIAADFDQAKSNLGEYASFGPIERRKNRYLIQDADTHLVSLISFSLNYNQAFCISLSTLAYMLFTRTALYADDKASGHITTLKDQLDAWLTKAFAEYQFLLSVQSPDARIKIVDDEDPGRPGQEVGGAGSGYTTPDEPGFYFSSVTLDGQEVGYFIDDHDKGRAHGLAVIFANAKVRPPVEAKFNEFKVQSLKALQLIAEGYKRMAKKVGMSYVPPIKELEIHTAEFPLVISLPTMLRSGAFVIGNPAISIPE